jgi:hypothetical protein
MPTLSTVGMLWNNKLSIIIIGSVILLYNWVAIFTCINKHKYIYNSCINKLPDYIEIGPKQNKTTKSIYYTLYISLSKLRAPRFASHQAFNLATSSTIKVKLGILSISLSI